VTVESNGAIRAAGTSACFEGRVALVTGAGSGIGRAAAFLFAERGARVAVADVDVEGGEATLEAVRAQGGEAVFLRADVSVATEVQAMVEGAVGAFGRLDFAYNNAGIGAPAHPLAEMPEELFDRAVAVMLKGVYLCMKYEIPHILEREGGAIVNAASGAGLIGFPGQCAYVASKHGVIGLTRSAALDYAKSGLRINAVCPGTARTGIVEDWTAGDPEREAEIAGYHPIGRIADPREIAEAVVWLCSEQASFVVGEALSVDGGYTTQ